MAKAGEIHVNLTVDTEVIVAMMEKLRVIESKLDGLHDAVCMLLTTDQKVDLITKHLDREGDAE